MKELAIRLQRSQASYSIPVSDTIWGASLVPLEPQTLVVPEGATYALFSCTGNFVLSEETPLVPPSGAFAQINAEINPTIRNVKAGESLYISGVDVACVITVMFYSTNQYG